VIPLVALRSLRTRLAVVLTSFLLASAAQALRLDEPVELGFLVTAGPALGVTVVGERVYVAAGNMGLRIIDERGSLRAQE
jgi:hypothetical protein